MLGWFGLVWFRAEAISILQREYGLEAKVVSGPLLNHVTREVRARGGNAYDAAAKFLCAKIVVWQEDGLSIDDVIADIVAVTYRLQAQMRHPQMAYRDLMDVR